MGIESNRHMALSCPLGKDVLVVRSLRGSEALSTCFEYELILRSEHPDVKAEALLGTHSGVRLRRGRQPDRHFDGIVCEFSHLGPEPQPAAVRERQYYSYRMVLRPWLWLLSRNRQCRVFQQKTTLDIFRELLDDYLDKELETRLTLDLQAREYCVQYRESDLSFISRLLEDEGIYYYFKHEEGHHKLVLSDSPSLHVPVRDLERLKFRRSERSDKEVRGPSVFSWQSHKGIQAGSFEHSDYDFEKPRACLREQRSCPAEHTNSAAEIFEYPGLYKDSGAGDALAAVRIQEIVSRYAVSEGTTDAIGLFPGALFTLQDFPREGDTCEYLVTSAYYNVDSGAFESGSAGVVLSPVSIGAIESATVFRPPRSTPRPAILGAQTATVVGAAGNEIWTDAYGRVKVQFHWDRFGQRNQDSSCFVRVAQPWAGDRWGAQFIPRVGQEVVVEFLDGDPDRPIVTGSVYNADNQLPFKPPGKQTQSGLKSRSTPHGTSNDFNELRFDDDKGSEEVHLQAQRDLNVRVKHDRAENIGNDANLTVKKNVNVHVVEGDHDTTVSKGMLRAKVEGGLYGATAKEIAFSADQTITLRVGDTSLQISVDGITLAVSSGSTIALRPADLLAFAGTVNINPLVPPPIMPAPLPPALSNVQTPKDKTGS